MADNIKNYRIKIDGIKESVDGIQSLGEKIKGTDIATTDYSKAIRETNKEIKQLQGQMIGLDKGTAQWTDLAKKAGELKDRVDDIREATRRYASDTKGLDDVINLTQSATASFTLCKGAMSAFGMETEEADKALQQLAGAMSIIQSLQTLQNTLKGSSATASLLTKSMNLLTLGMKGTTTATKTLKVALGSIGIGLVITAVSALVEHWEDLVNIINKSFPIFKKCGGFFNSLKAAAKGVGDAVINWIVNPYKTMADVLKKLFTGDFTGALEAAKNGIKQQFQGTLDSFNNGFKKQVELGLEEITNKAIEEQNKQTQYDLQMLKARKGNQAKYSKEGIALQKKDFDERKKLAKGNKDELNKIALEEANFYRECQENKSKAAQNAAKSAVDAAKKAEEEQKKVEEKAREYRLKAEDKLLKATLDNQIKNQELAIKAAKENVEKFKNGPENELLNALKRLEEEEQKLLDIQRAQKGVDHFIDYRENISGATDSLQTFKNSMEELLVLMKNVQENKGEGEIISTEEFSEAAKQVKEFSKLSQDEYKYLYAVYIDYVNDFLEQKKAKTIETEKEIAQKTIGINKKTIEDITAGISKFTTDLPQKVNTSIWDKLFNKDKAKKAANDYKTAWWNAMTAIQNKIPTLTMAWDEYLSKVKLIYGEDSKEYIEATQKKEEELKKLIELQNQAQNNVAKPQSGDKKSNSGNQFMDFDQNVIGDTNLGDIKKTIEDAYDAFVDPIVGGITDTIGMMMEFAIEEAQDALDEATEIHDKAVDKVNKSKTRLTEINTEMANASATRLETLKSQQADEMLLLAQREAEEKRAERVKEQKEKELEQKKKRQRKIELQVQMVQALASGALAAINGFATKPFVPVGLAMGALATTLTAVQLGVMAKQMSKLADGAILGGKPHSQGGVKIPSLGVEVERGEAVINKKSTAKYLPLLDAINAEGNGGKHTLLSTKQNAIKRYSNGGVLNGGGKQLNYERVSNNLATQDINNVIQSSIGQIDFHPVVSVVDINRGQKNLVNVRQIAGASK